MENEDYHFKLKFTFLGDSQVGKSEIIGLLGEKIAKRIKVSGSDEFDEKTCFELTYLLKGKLFLQFIHLGGCWKHETDRLLLSILFRLGCDFLRF